MADNMYNVCVHGAPREVTIAGRDGSPTGLISQSLWVRLPPPQPNTAIRGNMEDTEKQGLAKRPAPKIPSEATIMANTEHTIKYWNLGPKVPSEKPDSNKEYWQKAAKIWNTNEATARSQVCANCEYYNNTPEMLRTMNKIPFNKYDENAGGRGYCHKFDFICHNLRSCSAWERKEYEVPD